MVHIQHRLGIKAPLPAVYQALSTTAGIAHWWSEATSGDSEVGKSIFVTFHSPGGDEIGRMQMEPMTLDADKKVSWKFLDGPQEWIGTEVHFGLHTEDGYTIVMFAHKNWQEEVEFKSHCSMKWAVFLLSLKDYLETGKGKPAPFDFKIDNWN